MAVAAEEYEDCREHRNSYHRVVRMADGHDAMRVTERLEMKRQT